jgi:DNA invertase Pin-like site-specific DNA recombinase
LGFIYKETYQKHRGVLFKNKMNKKIAIYCRVSTRDQNPDNQKIILVERAKRENWDYEVFEEKESTRKTRPVKYKLMQMLRRKEYDGVCVLKLDRWARSMLELTNEITELYEKNILFISHRENIDFSTSLGKLQFNIIAAFAQFERDMISERTKDGLARAALEGRKGGRPKGSKDKKPRRKSGYYVRHMNTKKG